MTVPQIEAVRRLTPIVSVQNRYNLVDRGSEDVLEYCTREDIGFIPWFPLATGSLAKPGGPLARAGERLGAHPSQIAIAWLLRKSPVMLPIPGTSEGRAPRGEHRRGDDHAGRENDAGAGATHRGDVSAASCAFAISSIVRPVLAEVVWSAVTSEPGFACSSRCLMRSHCGFESPRRVRTSTHEPFSRFPWRTNLKSPFS